MAVQLIVIQSVTHNRIFLRKCARWSFHGLFPVGDRRLSAPMTRYPGRPQPAVQGRAAGPLASFDTGQYTSRSHHRTTGSGACRVTPNAAAAPTNGGQNDDVQASTKQPNPDTQPGDRWTIW